jgi:hypothetical protein
MSKMQEAKFGKPNGKMEIEERALKLRWSVYDTLLLQFLPSYEAMGVGAISGHAPSSCKLP